MINKKIAIVTVTYGNRWKFLSLLINSVIDDPNVFKLIIVDNGSFNKEEIENEVKKYQDKIVVIRHESNLGSAGGFASGLAYVRDVDCDFVLMLDDDNVPEPNAISMFLDGYNMLSGKRVVCGFRSDIQSSKIFSSTVKNTELIKTFFDVWNFEKLKRFFNKLFYIKEEDFVNKFYPIIPIQGFVYGGAFLPIKAIREAPLPDKSLILYGDDVEYSWGVIDAGYATYLCSHPVIRDVDMSFEGGDHILGLFNLKTQAFKVYFRIRNMIRISLRNTMQTRIGLHTSIFIWILGLFVFGAIKYGITAHTIKRMRLIFSAVYGGYIVDAKIPDSAKLP
jgi:GT2 family glycosyltransferase